MLAKRFLDLVGGREMRFERVGEGNFAFLLGGEEVNGVDVAVSVDEVFEVANEGGEGSLGRASDADFECERLLTPFFPEYCVGWPIQRVVDVLWTKKQDERGTEPRTWA